MCKRISLPACLDTRIGAAVLYNCKKDKLACVPGWFYDMMHDLGGATFPMGFFFYNDVPGVRADPSLW